MCFTTLSIPLIFIVLFSLQFIPCLVIIESMVTPRVRLTLLFTFDLQAFESLWQVCLNLRSVHTTCRLYEWAVSILFATSQQTWSFGLRLRYARRFALMMVVCSWNWTKRVGSTSLGERRKRLVEGKHWAKSTLLAKLKHRTDMHMRWMWSSNLFPNEADDPTLKIALCLGE